MKLNNRFSVERDTHCWVLEELCPGKTKDGHECMTTKKTYHATIEQAVKFVMDKRMGECQDLKDLYNLLITTKNMLAKKVKRDLDNESRT